ncbi:hypothetical protein PSN_4858 [Pseudomonas sp. NGC7]
MYGNETPPFSACQKPAKTSKPLISLGFEKLARHLLYA